MTFERFKLAFLAFAFVCVAQNALAAPRALAGGSQQSAMPAELEIVGRAASEIATSVADLFKSLGAILSHALAEGFAKVALPVYLKAHLILTASGVQDASLTFTGDQHREYRIVAKTLLRLRTKLDVMERFDEVFESILAQVSVSALHAKPTEQQMPGQILSGLIQSFYETAERRLSQHPELSAAYARTREIIRVEDAKSKPIVLDFSKMSGDSQRMTELLPETVRVEMLKVIINKQFLHHTLNRFTVIKKEYFVAARSTLELAKKPAKLDAVQQLYDKTVREVSTYLDALKADTFDVSKGLFKELKSNFEANPSLNQEWREVQKYVSQRHEWDRSIWDLDLIPL